MKTRSKTTAPTLLSAFQALGDPNRYQIVKLLSRDNQLCVSEVAAEIGITTAGVSQHMKVLESAGLVRPQRRGQKICYQLSDSEQTRRTLIELIRRKS